MTLKQIRVDGQTYWLESYTSRSLNGERVTRFRVRDEEGEAYDIKATFYPLREQKEIYGEMMKTLEEEIKLEISSKNDGEYWNKAVADLA